MIKRRKRCTWCGKNSAVKQDGQLHRHQGTEPHPLGHKRMSCPGGAQWNGVPPPKPRSKSMFECERCGEPTHHVNGQGQCPDCVVAVYDDT